MAGGSIIIYLAGPIDGVSQDDAKGWREEVEERMGTGVLLFSPAHAYRNVHPVNAQSIDFINKGVIKMADGVLANLSGPGRGFGTIREIEFARLHQLPVAVVGDLDIHFSAHDCILSADWDEAIQLLIEKINERRELAQNPMMVLGFPGFGPQEHGDDD